MLPLLFALVFALPVAAQDEWDKVVLLQKVKRHIGEGVKRLPDYTCLQTAARYRKRAGEREQERHIDTLVLEVLNAGDKELYASPGDKSFHAESPAEFTGHGMTGTGSFGLFLKMLFVNDSGMFTYRGEEPFGGRTALKWDYRVPVTMSGYILNIGYSRGTVGMRGSFLVDAKTLDLLQLSVSANEIPPNLPLVSATQTVEYALMRIGDRDVMLPQNASMKIAEDSGAQSRNVVEFTHCQSFRVESTLSFNAPADGPATTSVAPDPARPIGEGLLVTIELAAAVTDKLPVGSMIEGRVAADVLDRRRIAVRAGSAVRGRIRRLEREDDHWVVGLEFTEIEAESGPARFYANLQELDKQSGATFSVTLTLKPTRREELFLGYLPGVAHFFVPGASLNLPKGFKTVWKTTWARGGRR